MATAAPAPAQLLITLDPNSRTLDPQGFATFSGTVRNISSEAVTINAVLFSIEDVFIANSLFATPRQIAGNTSFTESLFTVQAAPGTGAGTYNGRYRLTDSTGDSFDDFFTINIETAVVPAPPPPLLFGSAMGLVGLVQAGRSHRARRRKATGADGTSAVD